MRRVETRRSQSRLPSFTLPLAAARFCGVVICIISTHTDIVNTSFGTTRAPVCSPVEGLQVAFQHWIRLFQSVSQPFWGYDANVRPNEGVHCGDVAWVVRCGEVAQHPAAPELTESIRVAQDMATVVENLGSVRPHVSLWCSTFVQVARDGGRRRGEFGRGSRLVRPRRSLRLC